MFVASPFLVPLFSKVFILCQILLLNVHKNPLPCHACSSNWTLVLSGPATLWSMVTLFCGPSSPNEPGPYPTHQRPIQTDLSFYISTHTNSEYSCCGWIGSQVSYIVVVVVRSWKYSVDQEQSLQCFPRDRVWSIPCYFAVISWTKIHQHFQEPKDKRKASKLHLILSTRDSRIDDADRKKGSHPNKTHSVRFFHRKSSGSRAQQKGKKMSPFWANEWKKHFGASTGHTQPNLQNCMYEYDFMIHKPFFNGFLDKYASTLLKLEPSH